MEEKLYTENEVKEITEQAKKEMFQNKIMQYAKQIESLVSNNLVVSQKKKPFSKKFTAENVQRYLENPVKYEKELRQLSLVLITISPQYSQICSYLASISKFIPVINPNMSKFTNAKNELLDPDKLKKEYLKCCEYVDSMKVAHEFQKIMEVIARDDIFYGYCIDNKKDSFYIMELDSDYCKISSVTDGCYNIAFDYSFFDTTKSMKDISANGESDDLINYYPKEFQQGYKKYKSDSRFKIQELSDENTICIKFSEMLPFIFPKYASLFEDLSDLKTYKELGKAKAESDNYKFIAMEMESNKKGNTDDFTTSIDTVMQFYTMLDANLPDGVGSFISPVPVKDISFSTTAVSDKSAIDNALNNTYISSGISAVNFGKGTTNAGTVKMSNIIDESSLFKIYRQFERWLSRRLNRLFGYKFSVRLLDVTTLSIGDEIDRQLKLAQYGIPNKLILSALSGISQNQERGMSALEDILDLSNTWRPLSSSFTQSGNDSSSERGRPSIKDENVESENTEASKNNDSNSNKV